MRVFTVLLTAGLGVSAMAQPSASTQLQRPRDIAAQMERGAQYLLTAQEAEGGWAGETGPGVSALCVWALAQTPGIGPEHAAVQRGIAFILRSKRDDGGVYSAEGLLKNYESSVVLSMLARVDAKRYAEEIKRLQQFLTRSQWDEDESITPENPWYGGAGYGRGKRPDLSNTQIMLEALHDSGLAPSDPAYRKALIFIERSQMRGESNDQSFARGSSQGGFIYSPANGGESKAGEIEIEGRKELRSYGSMTYAGFKSMLYAGLKRDDPRVTAAIDWIRRHWTLDFNPNMPEQQSKEGLFYYYHVFARAMQAWGEPELRDALGRSRNWREELATTLGRQQRPDGSWVNEEDRWMEGLPALTTAYSLLALSAARSEDVQRP